MKFRFSTTPLFSVLTVLSIVFLAGCNMGTPAPIDTETPTQQDDREMTQTSQQTTASIEVVGDNMESDEALDDEMAEESAERVSAALAANEPVYKAYDAAEREELHGNEPYVLFYHANWCPICRAMEKNITEQLESFPAGTKILKADYDTEDALKDEYDVRVQSTVIVVDANGEVVWKGQDPSVDDLKSYIEDSLA